MNSLAQRTTHAPPPAPMLPFHNPDLDALNVLEIDVDPAVVERLRPHLEGYRHNPESHVQCPPWNNDSEWISPNSLAMFRVYRQVFDALDPAPIRAIW